MTLLAASSRPAAQDVIGNFPVVQVPPENPLTPEKILLGKALFFEEQMSTDNTMACATCHISQFGGTDPRAGLRHPGVDGILNTPDDEFGSPGVVRQDAKGDFEVDPVFDVGVQGTPRNAPGVVDAAFFNTQFWDSRALPTFTDLAGNVVIPAYASLESQAVQPIVSAVEMGHDGRTWDEVTAKLARVRPLDLAVDVPAPLAAFVGDGEGYGPLFRRAFGTSEITRERVAMAIASYERTLVADQTPFDLGTMTARQQAGFGVYQTRGFCTICHPPSNNLFTDGAMRPINLPDHPRAVKTPGLRNAGLHRRFMSSGQFASMDEVITHYENIHFVHFQNGLERAELIDFLVNGLTDPRVAQGLPPFDRPHLRSEVEPHGSRLYGTATAGSGGRIPQMLADTPANLGNSEFKIGVGDGRGGATAVLLMNGQRSFPGTSLHGVPVNVELIGSERLIVRLSADGVATFHAPIPDDPGLVGIHFCAQWFVLDPQASGGASTTQAAEFAVFSRVFRQRARLDQL